MTTYNFYLNLHMEHTPYPDRAEMLEDFIFICYLEVNSYLYKGVLKKCQDILQ